MQSKQFFELLHWQQWQEGEQEQQEQPQSSAIVCGDDKVVATNENPTLFESPFCQKMQELARRQQPSKRRYNHWVVFARRRGQDDTVVFASKKRDDVDDFLRLKAQEPQAVRKGLSVEVLGIEYIIGQEKR